MLKIFAYVDLCRLYRKMTINPFKLIEISLYLSIGPDHFCLKGCKMVFFIFVRISVKHSVSKQWRLIRRWTPHFEASDLGRHCLHMSHKRMLGLYGFNDIFYKIYAICIGNSNMFCCALSE